MPKLNTLIEVGFCQGYNDGDYAVSGGVAELSRERFMELLAAIAFAQNCAIEMWRREQERKNQTTASIRVE